jgi:hypothetical protein
MAKICIVILDHRNSRYLQDLIDGIRFSCPDADIAWYNSGEHPPAPGTPAAGLPMLPNSRPLRYAKVTPFFFDMFDWAAGQPYDYIVNAETDMAFIRPGYHRFITEAMRDADYLVTRFQRGLPPDTRWAPYLNLVPDLPELFGILGIQSLNKGFSPAQVFSARYVASLVGSPWYADLRGFIARNQDPGKSRTLQELLVPTLADVLGLRVRDYPAQFSPFNRYRPYQSLENVLAARATKDAYFVHPVLRDEADPARQAVRQFARRTTCPPSGL